MPTIHPSAIVERGAELAEDTVVGPLCHVGPKVRLGAGTRLISHATVLGRTTLGEGNTVWPYATLGADPQDLKFRGDDTEVVIGDRNEIRENVTVHKGTEKGGGVTRIGSECLLMVGCHVAHDCEVGDHVIIANNVLLAGHVVVESRAALAGGAAVHHFVTVGRYAYVGGLTRIVHDVPPYMVVEGHPARVRKVNTVLLERSGFEPRQVERLKKAFRMLYGDGDGKFVGRTAEALKTLERDYPGEAPIEALVGHIRRSTQGVRGRYREAARRGVGPAAVASQAAPQPDAVP